jgi:type VI secretion system secreted protein Hcp
MAVDMFMKIDDLKGEARDGATKGTKHDGEIGVISWAWGMTQTGSTHDGTGSGTGKVNVQDLSFTKYCDKASPVLMQYCCNGKHFGNAILTCRKAGGEKPVEYLVIKMYDIIISSVSTGGGGNDERITEHVSLNFAKFELTYTPQTAKGDPDAAIPAKYDIAQNG